MRPSGARGKRSGAFPGLPPWAILISPLRGGRFEQGSQSFPAIRARFAQDLFQMRAKPQRRRKLVAEAMAKSKSIRDLLAEGRCAFASGRAFDVAMMVLEQPRLANRLIECLWDESEAVVLRAADALDTVSYEMPRVLAAWKEPLLGLMTEAKPIKLRWHLAFFVSRLRLTPAECRRAATVLRTWLDDRSSIVKTSAMQTLADLTRQDPSLLAEVLDLLRVLTRSGTPAMRARGRVLVKQLETGQPTTWKRSKPQALSAARMMR